MGPTNPDQRDAQVLATVVSSAVDGIIVIDRHGRIEAFNPAAERLFGYSPSEVVGRNVSMLMPSPYREEHDGYLARYAETGEARIIGIGRDVKGLRRDGSVFPLHLSVGQMSIDGERKFVGTLHDLTARVALEDRLRASEERWRSVIESAVDGIAVIDARGRIEVFNPAAERMFGYAEAELIGRNVNMLMPSPYREEHDGYLSRYLQSGKPKIIGIGREMTGRRADGSTFPLHLAVGEMVVGGERKFTGILRDLTSRVELEGRLREQAALVRLGEMAAVIAHEVRNPLAGIRGAVQVIGSRLPPEGQEAVVVGEIVSRIDTLNGLMQDLLLFARPPRPRVAPIPVTPLIASSADLLCSDPALDGIRVETDGEAPPIAADAELVKIVFLNLLVNAAHAMRGQGRIRVSVETSDHVCRVAFKDTGPGIAADIRDKVFIPFFTTKSRGTGLGLATAKRLVEAQDGAIWIECPPAGGTTVTVQLPLAAASVDGAVLEPG